MFAQNIELGTIVSSVTNSKENQYIGQREREGEGEGGEGRGGRRREREGDRGR
jgi:hypothetical protein